MLSSSCHLTRSTEVVHAQVTRYTGTALCFLHTVRGEGQDPKTPGSHDDALAKPLLHGLGHLGFLLGMVKAGGRPPVMVQQHVK